MAKFAIEPHFRLQEWVADEKGYFRRQGLDYEFNEFIRSSGGAHHDSEGRGAFQSIEKGRESNVTCACHWTVNAAAGNGHTKLFADAYSVAPAAIFVPADSPIRSPEDLADIPISVGFQSGSHYATIQALERFMPSERIKLSFDEGMLFHRMEAFLEGRSRAATLFSGPYYFAEQLGYRKLVDTTFMIASMINGNPGRDDLGKYFEALRLAQRDIDLRPELYTHYYKNEFPEHFHDRIDTRRWGPGERIVFEPYTRQVFEETYDWIAEHRIFESGALGSRRYEDAVLSLVP